MPAVQEWFDYYYSNEMQWYGQQEINSDAFPGVTFRWSPAAVEAISNEQITCLYSGMPIWSVLFADITGDGLPELCSTVFFGSGIVDNRIIIYDYANGASYSLENRMKYDYRIFMQDGQLAVTGKRWLQEETESGCLTYTDGTVQFVPFKINSAE